MEATPAHNTNLKGTQLVIPRGWYQSDFTALQPPCSEEWLEVLRQKTVPINEVPPFTLLRFRRGEYGERILADGSVISGGLQQEMARFDRALASRYPVQIVVIHHQPGGGHARTIKESSWRGSVRIHPFDLNAPLLTHHRETLTRIISEAKPDIAHFHHPDSALELQLLNSLPQDLPVVVSLHGAPAQRPVTTDQSRFFPGLQESVRRFAWWGQIYRDAYSLPKAVRLLCQKTVGALLRGTVHMPVNHKEEIYDIVQRRGLGAYKRSCFSAVSESGKALFLRREATVIHPPVDSDFFTPSAVPLTRRNKLRADLNIPSSHHILLYHARISIAKGQHLLPRIAAALKDKTDKPFVVLIAGPEYDRDCADLVRANCRRFGVTDNVKMLSGRDQAGIRELLSIADVGLFPTLDEGLGLTAVECQLMQVPVVAHRVGGVPEVVSDNETGRLVEVGDYDGFASAIADLLNDPVRRKAMGETGRACARERFDHDNLSRLLIQNLYLPAVLNKRSA